MSASTDQPDGPLLLGPLLRYVDDSSATLHPVATVDVPLGSAPS